MKAPPDDLLLLTSRLQGRKDIAHDTWITISTYRAFLSEDSAPPNNRRPEAGICRAIEALVEDKDLPDDCSSFRSSEHFTVRLPGFKDVVVAFPVDWAADPHNDRGWRNGFQSLNFLPLLLQSPQGLTTAVEIVRSYAVRAANPNSPLEFSFDEHAVASRLNNIVHLIFAITRSHFRISSPSFEAIMTILFTHIYMLSDSENYPIRHNHGLMRDKALLTHAQHFAEMKDAMVLQEIAEYRMQHLQIRKSVTNDYFHVENSPWYHLFFVRLLSEIVKSCYHDFGRTPPKYLLQTRNRCASTLLSLIQPNFQLAPFGDTLRWDISSAVGRLIVLSDASSPFPPSLKKRLRYIATRGRYGVSHLPVSFVSQEAGYAVLRAETSSQPDTAEAALIYIKGSRLSRVHSHADETSFLAFAFGQEALIDPGRYSNDRGRKETTVSVSALGHNILRPINYTGASSRAGNSRIIDSEQLDNASHLVIMRHNFFHDLGVREYRRILVRLFRSAIIVGDLIVADRSLQFREQLLLHPNFLPAQAPERTLDALTFCRADGCGMRIVGGTLLSEHSASKPALMHTSAAFYPRERERQETTQVLVDFEAGEGACLYCYQVQFFNSVDDPQISFSSRLEEDRLILEASHMGSSVKSDLSFERLLLKAR